MNAKKDITLEELRDKFVDFLTVGELKKYLEKHNIPDSAKIVVQRVEDRYYEENNWDTVKKEGEMYHMLKRWNDDVDSGKYLDKEQYPNIDPEKDLTKFSEENLLEARSEYTPVWSCVTYRDDPNNLYLDLHY